MSSNAKVRAISLIVIGLFGMAAYQVIAHLQHPAIMDQDSFHGIWFGVCFGLEIAGVYQLSKIRRSAP